MTTTAIILVNLFLAALVVAGLAAAVALAHRLPRTTSRDRLDWGLGERGVPSEPLPLRPLVESELQRAA